MTAGHDHPTGDYHRSFTVGVVLNVAYVAVEAGFGLHSGSLALVADAGHNLGDVAGLLLAWGAMAMARRGVSRKRTYGFRKATVLASLVSSIILFVALGGIALEAVGRFAVPRAVPGTTIIVVAAIGVAVNTVTALMFVRGQKDDLNIRGAFLHMAADAGVSLGVVAAGVLIGTFGWLWIDPVISLVVVVVVAWSAWGLLRRSLDYSLDAVPEGIDHAEIEHFLSGRDRVTGLHDLHVWPLSTTETALTAHLVVDGDSLDNHFLDGLQRELHDRFGIDHTTIQVESARLDGDCPLEGDDAL